MVSAKRLQRDLADIKKCEGMEDCPIKLEPNGDDLSEFKGELTGPPGTPYEGATFILDFKIPETYPLKPPKVKFVTSIWHPNINTNTGEICLDTLADKWAACLNLRTVMLSIQALLTAPEPDDPLDCTVADQLCRKPELFEQTARHWANVYAGGPHREIELEEKVKAVVDLGHAEQYARYKLSRSYWDVNHVVEKINKK